MSQVPSCTFSIGNEGGVGPGFALSNGSKILTGVFLHQMVHIVSEHKGSGHIGPKAFQYVRQMTEPRNLPIFSTSSNESCH